MGAYAMAAMMAVEVAENAYGMYKSSDSNKTQGSVLKAKEKAEELQAEELQTANVDKTLNLIKSGEAMQTSGGFDLASGTFKAASLEIFKTMRENSEKIDMNKNLEDLNIEVEKLSLQDRAQSSLIGGVARMGESAFKIFG